MRKKGILIANAFLRADKFTEHYEWLQRAAEKHFVKLELCDNASCLSLCGGKLGWLDNFDFVLYWDKDIGFGKEITRYAQGRGIRVFNPVDSIAACDDKFETYHRIACYNDRHPEDSVPILPTILAPMTYGNIGYTDLGFLNQVEEELSYPMVVKECCGSFGMQVYLADGRQELERLTEQLAGTSFLYQKYHQYSSGRDVRIQVVGGRAVAAMCRWSDNGDFRANISNGGHMERYRPSPGEEELAVKAARILGLDFAGVDLLFEETGMGSERASLLCEVNSNAHFKNIHACTGVDVADAIISYISAT